MIPICEILNDIYILSLRGPVLSKCQGPYGEIVVRCSSSSSSSSGSSSNSSSSESAGNASKPRIVLIGWLGAQERHFQK